MVMMMMMNFPADSVDRPFDVDGCIEILSAKTI